MNRHRMRTRRQRTAYWRMRTAAVPVATLVDIVVTDLALRCARRGGESPTLAKRRVQMEHLRAALPGMWPYVAPWIADAVGAPA